MFRSQGCAELVRTARYLILDLRRFANEPTSGHLTSSSATSHSYAARSQHNHRFPFVDPVAVGLLYCIFEVHFASGFMHQRIAEIVHELGIFPGFFLGLPANDSEPIPQVDERSAPTIFKYSAASRLTENACDQS